MTRRILFRRNLLRAVEAFIEGSPVSIAQGCRIIARCRKAISQESKEFTLDQLIWDNLITPLSDSVYYTDEDYLREVRNVLVGLSVPNREKCFISEDFRPYFSADEMEWYTQLGNLVNFIADIPFAHIENAVAEYKHRQIPWAIMFESVPEAARVKAVEEEYEQRCAAIKDMSSRIPQPEDVGDEKFYCLVLREVMAVITALSIRQSALLYGHLSPAPPYSGGLGSDMTESIVWAKRALGAIAGEGTLLFTWRLVKAPTFDADLLILALH